MAGMDDSEITLKSGRKIYANLGIIGLSPDLEVSGGYDGGLMYADRRGADDDVYESVDDLREIADLMIARWAAYKQKITPP